MSFVVIFNLVLFIATLVTGVVWIADKLWLARKRRSAVPEGSEAARPGAIVDFCVSLFPVICAVFVVRSFIVEPFRIPSGSMIPTLRVGDFILVNKFDYGLRSPVGDFKLLKTGEPQRGDVVVFRYPAQSEDDPNFGNDFIKRVIGVPGDHIVYENHVLTVNGERIETVPGSVDLSDGFTQGFEENLNGVKHIINIRPEVAGKSADVVVPPDSYFMMGDNRDLSNDSRYWGFVPESNLKGKAILIWMSWGDHLKPAFSRFGTVIH